MKNVGLWLIGKQLRRSKKRGGRVYKTSSNAIVGHEGCIDCASERISSALRDTRERRINEHLLNRSACSCGNSPGADSIQDVIKYGKIHPVMEQCYFVSISTGGALGVETNIIIRPDFETYHVG